MNHSCGYMWKDVRRCGPYPYLNDYPLNPPALYCGVQFIIKNYICTGDPMRFAKPVRNVCLIPLKPGPDCRVFLNEKESTVCKYYSARERPDETPDLQLWKKFEHAIYGNAKVEFISRPANDIIY